MVRECFNAQRTVLVLASKHKTPKPVSIDNQTPKPVSTDTQTPNPVSIDAQTPKPVKYRYPDSKSCSNTVYIHMYTYVQMLVLF